MNPDPTPTPDEIAAAKEAMLLIAQAEQQHLRIQHNLMGQHISSIVARHNAKLHAEVEALKKERDCLEEEIKALNPASTKAGHIFNQMRLAFVALGKSEFEFKPHKMVEAAKDTQAELAQLKKWKAEALTVSNQLNLQAIAKELGLPLGCEIAPRVLPGIVALKKERDRLQSLIDADPHALVSVTNRAVLIANAATEELTVLKKERDDTGKAFVLQSVELGRLTNQLATLRKQVKAGEGLADAIKDLTSKIEDFDAGKINWRPVDFLFRSRTALAQWESAKTS